MLSTAHFLVGLLGLLGLLLACSGEANRGSDPARTAEQNPEPATDAALASDKLVEYDLRRIRPKAEETLEQSFERMRQQARAEGKQVALLFSAGWCEPCRSLELELGNRQPEAKIGWIRILEIKEEDWEPLSRMDEVERLRSRYYPEQNYPVLVVLDENGAGREEMQQAIDRLERVNVAPTLAAWLEDIRPPAAKKTTPG